MLQQEPQVKYSTHLQAYLADDGVLILQNIELRRLAFEVVLQDFVETHYLGPLFALNPQTARLLADGDCSLLAGTLLLPDFSPSAVTLKFTTSIQVYGESAERKSNLNSRYLDIDASIGLSLFHAWLSDMSRALILILCLML